MQINAILLDMLRSQRQLYLRLTRDGLAISTREGSASSELGVDIHTKKLSLPNVCHIPLQH